MAASAGGTGASSIGAPRRTRLRMAESEKVEAEITSFPPEPIGQVRVRLLTDTAVADLRGLPVGTPPGRDEVEVALCLRLGRELPSAAIARVAR